MPGFVTKRGTNPEIDQMLTFRNCLRPMYSEALIELNERDPVEWAG
jgi:hypothetical protein